MHVEDPEQVKARQQTAQHGSQGIASVEVAEPRDAARGHLYPSGHHRQGRSHQDGWREEAQGCEDAAEEEPGDAMPDRCRIHELNEGHRRQHQNPAGTDGELKDRVDAYGMPVAPHVAGHEEAPETHPTHEGPQEDAHGDRGGPKYELKQLEPSESRR